MKNTALIIVDVQNDFVEGGALGVTGGNQVANDVVKTIESGRFSHIITTQDWHIDPGAHFELWGEHCVAKTDGANLVEVVRSAVNTSNLIPGVKGSYSVFKGAYNDGYSGFSSVEKTDGDSYVAEDSDLAVYIRNHDIEELVVVGIATDFCVRATVLDAIAMVDKVYVLTDQIAGVNAETIKTALDEMTEAGAILITSAEYMKDEGNN